MKRNSIKILSLIACVTVLIGLLAVPSSANSAQTQWQGIDSAGSTVIDGNCPIEVVGEVLTFDIDTFPDFYGIYTEDTANSYDAKVTAEYTFRNPSDLTVSARLAFPFGNLPSYYSYTYDAKTGERVPISDTERYSITVDGETIDRVVRHTYGSNTQFDLDKDLTRLSDEYITDSFFSPEPRDEIYIYCRRRVQGGADR